MKRYSLVSNHTIKQFKVHNSKLVEVAFSSLCVSLDKIKRSLSKKGNPYDNGVAEATYKIIKTEFVNNNKLC